MKNLLIHSPGVQKSKFVQQLEQNKTIFWNGKEMHISIYNLFIEKRNVKSSILGLKPHATWKVSDVKKYFGIKGSKDQVLNQLIQLNEDYRYLISQV
tara:strand:- start:786 stop:1076 length:291 start_codon:yes stop_codon:yes gene_type:complete